MSRLLLIQQMTPKYKVAYSMVYTIIPYPWGSFVKELVACQWPQCDEIAATETHG